MRLIKILSVSIFFMLSINLMSYASVARYCNISYLTNNGYSPSYKMHATFMSGEELNKATQQFKYNPFYDYVIVWIGENQPIILKLSSTLPKSSIGPLNDRDFDGFFDYSNKVYAVQVNSKYPRKWVIEYE